MYSRILNCDYEFVSPWWDEVSLNAKDLVSSSSVQTFSNKTEFEFLLGTEKYSVLFCIN